MKFKVGDIVRGACESSKEYTWTNEYMTKGLVTEVFEESNQMNVKILKHIKHPAQEGSEWKVQQAYFELVPDQKIVITTKGDTVTAKEYCGKDVVKTYNAKCSPDDDFDFKIGAKIAFDRLMENKQFKPHLERVGKLYGEIGTPTNMKDCRGMSLYVGDVVGVIKDYDVCHGLHSVVLRAGKAFIMGIGDACHNDGSIDDDWLVIKKQSYTEMTHLDIVDGIKYIIEG